MELREALFSALLGVVEGVTEWLPVSSTAHLLLVERFTHTGFSPEFRELFDVVIQFFAAASVACCCFSRLSPFGKRKTGVEKREILRLWGRVVIGTLPAGVSGIALRLILGGIPSSPHLIAFTLAFYGVAFLVVERAQKERVPRVSSVSEITARDALAIGCMQALSVLPGTSRSGACILGALLCGISRPAGTEFAFFLSLPVMAAASLAEIAFSASGGYVPSTAEISYLAIGSACAFLVSVVAIRALTDFVRRHTFAPFSYYRLALSALIVAVS